MDRIRARAAAKRARRRKRHGVKRSVAPPEVPIIEIKPPKVKEKPRVRAASKRVDKDRSEEKRPEPDEEPDKEQDEKQEEQEEAHEEMI